MKRKGRPDLLPQLQIEEEEAASPPKHVNRFERLVEDPDSFVATTATNATPLFDKATDIAAP